MHEASLTEADGQQCEPAHLHCEAGQNLSATEGRRDRRQGRHMGGIGFGSDTERAVAAVAEAVSERTYVAGWRR